MDNSFIRKLNRKYLKRNSPTDVIAFNLTEAGSKDILMADIVISTDVALANSKLFGTTPVEELYLYIIHGLLHLLGYQDKTLSQRRIMENRQSELINIIKAF